MTQKYTPRRRPRRTGRQQKTRQRMELAVTSAGRRRVIAQWPAGLGRILALIVVVGVLALLVAPDVAARVTAAIIFLSQAMEKR